MSAVPAVTGKSAGRFLLVAGLVEMVLIGAVGWWPAGAAAWPRPLLFWAAFAVYAVAAQRTFDSRGGEPVIWLLAIAMRLALLPLLPELSHDVYRYLWDGNVQLAGLNPYLHVPTDPALAGLRAPMHALIEHPDLPTPYPPFAQMAFLAIALAGGAVFQAKLLWLGLDLGTGWLLGRVARITGRSRRITQLLYLWSPLLLVEVAWNGHYQPLGIFAMALVILLARAPASAGVSAALSTLSGFIPIAALPALVRRLGRRFLIAFLAVLVVPCLAYATAGWNLLEGFLVHAREARFLAGPFMLLEAVLPGSWAPRVAVAVLVLVVASWAAVRRFRPERALFWVVGAFLLLAPELQPAYLLWILPLAALRLNRAWILMTGLVFVAYVGMDSHAATGVWPQPVWARLLLWLPVLGLLARDGARMWMERFPEPLPLSERRQHPREE